MMPQSPMKQSWMERAKETRKFHSSKLKENSKWRIQDTATALKRSLGSISDDLLIANWCKTHQKQLERFDYAKEALAFIREKETQMLMDEVD